MHVMITGGCGYVGTMLTQELLNRGYRVTVVDWMWFGNWLPEHPRLKVVPEDVRLAEKVDMKGVDALIHLANIANDPCGELDCRLVWEVNVLATMRLVEQALRHGVRQLIYASSGSVYGVRGECDVTEDVPLVPISDYNKTKMISERVLLSYKDRILIQCVRPGTVCGYSPRMRLDLSVNMLTMQGLTRGVITVLGGNQTRPNIHMHDIVAVYLHLLELKEKAAGIYNAGFENLSILDIARRITEYVPAEIRISGSNDPRSYRLNSGRLLSTGFQPRHGVNEGIEEVIEAFRAGKLRDEDRYYNVRVMNKLAGYAERTS